MIRREMPNGVTVSDWLGTASTAAILGSKALEDIREQRTPGPEAALQRAETELIQALGEVQAVMQELGMDLAHYAPSVAVD